MKHGGQIVMSGVKLDGRTNATERREAVWPRQTTTKPRHVRFATNAYRTERGATGSPHPSSFVRGLLRFVRGRPSARVIARRYVRVRTAGEEMLGGRLGLIGRQHPGRTLCLDRSREVRAKERSNELAGHTEFVGDLLRSIGRVRIDRNGRCVLLRHSLYLLNRDAHSFVGGAAPERWRRMSETFDRRSLIARSPNVKRSYVANVYRFVIDRVHAIASAHRSFVACALTTFADQATSSTLTTCHPPAARRRRNRRRRGVACERSEASREARPHKQATYGGE